MKMNLRWLEDKVLFMGFRYFLILTPSFIFINILIVAKSNESYSIKHTLISSIAGFIVAHLLYLIGSYWYLRRDKVAKCYMGDKYKPPIMFPRDKTSKIRFEPFSQFALMYLILSPGFAVVIAAAFD